MPSTTSLIATFTASLSEMANDEKVRAVVITGAGPLSAPEGV